MNIFLWILQIALAVMFAMHGWLFLAPPPEMADAIISAYPPPVRYLIGISEVLGALGLLLPGITRIMPILTVWAATGLAIVVALATGYHLTRGEFSSAGVTALLCVAAAFVAYMRWKRSSVVAQAWNERQTSDTKEAYNS
jgi:uncharacterized membrane protein YphA (DoxX/SURF4 family)